MEAYPNESVALDCQFVDRRGYTVLTQVRKKKSMLESKSEGQKESKLSDATTNSITQLCNFVWGHPQTKMHISGGGSDLLGNVISQTQIRRKLSNFSILNSTPFSLHLAAFAVLQRWCYCIISSRVVKKIQGGWSMFFTFKKREMNMSSSQLACRLHS